MSKALAKADEAQLPAELAAQFEADAGAGNENVRAEDLTMPFLKVLQKMSPELDKRAPEFIAGAEEGHILNTSSMQIWEADKEEDPVYVVPCYYNRAIIEWRPREKGGGIVNRYSRDDNLPATTQDEKGREVTAEGNHLVHTLEFFVLITNKDQTAAEQALISMSSTQMKYGRKWNNIITNTKIPGRHASVPRYGQVFKLNTMGEQNDQGSWASWKITQAGFVTSRELYDEAKAFHETMQRGEGKEVKYTEEKTTDVM